uniref:Uncharacterized protein n=1 Tax=Acrobeloides nanus TaxID=290746 RepID=A0A914E8R6_9BILA
MSRYEFLNFSILFIFTVGTVYTDNPPCANSQYTRYSNGRCYRNFSTPMKVAEAEATCQADGAHLVSVHNITDNDAVSLISASLGDSWLGLNCTSNTDCFWFDGSAYNYNNFGGEIANTLLGNCAYFSVNSNEWQSTSCEFEFKIAICQLPEIAPSQCPTWYNLSPDGRCYYFNANMVSFDQAQSDCESKNGNLASIHSIQQDSTIYNLAVQNDQLKAIWIGLIFKDATYVWTDGTNLDYQNWSNPFPNDRYGSCVKMATDPTDITNSGKWTNSECTNVFSYICVAEAQFVSSTPTLFPPPATLSPPGVCPMNSYYSDDGILSSPGYPSYYGGNVQCEYHLNVPLSDFVSIRFADWSLKAGDYVELYDGDDEPVLMVRLNASDAIDPNHYYTTNKTNLMLVRFYSGAGNAIVRGWVAPFSPTGPVTLPTTPITYSIGYTGGYTYQPVPPYQCPQMLYYYYGMIVSPGYPYNYGPNLNCTYILQAYPGQAVRIIFGEIHTETCCDFIFVFDGPNLSSKQIAVIEGLQQAGTKTFTSTGQFMTIQFTSDSIIEFTGWSANFSSVTCTGQGCTTITPSISAATSTTTSPLCQGWIQDPSKNQCYKYFQNGGGFYQNYNSCQNTGGSLLSIHDAFQENFIINLIQNAQPNNPYYVWIGLHRSSSENPWSWIDGSTLDYKAWGKGEPNGDEDCAVIRTWASAGWVVSNCSISLSYICYRTY